MKYFNLFIKHTVENFVAILPYQLHSDCVVVGLRPCMGPLSDQVNSSVDCTEHVGGPGRLRSFR
jgi:hypothetical protein